MYRRSQLCFAVLLALLAGCTYAGGSCCDPYGNCCNADAYGNCPPDYSYYSGGNPQQYGTTGYAGPTGGSTGVTVTVTLGTGSGGESTTSSNGGWGTTSSTTSNTTSSTASSTSVGTSASGTGSTTSSTTGTGTTGGEGSSNSGGGTGYATSGGTSGGTGGSDAGTGVDAGSGDDAGVDGGTDAGPMIGSPCTCDADCASGEFCFPMLNYASDSDAGTQWANGYCTVYNCDQQTPCPDGAICYNYPQGSASLYSLCLATCQSPACDRAGYSCGEIGDPVSACLPECVHDCDCSTGLVCESGSCQQPCYVDGECGPNEICNDNHCQAGPPLACCDVPGMTPCPSGMTCETGACVIDCQFDVDCPAGERCLSNAQCG